MSNILGNMPPVFGSGYRGVVPAPSAADVSAQNILRADGVWAAGPSGTLPSQTGNAGKLLTTDGTNASWSSTLSGNLTVSGTGGVQLNSVANLTWGGAYGAGIPTIAIPSATSIGFYPTGSTSGKTFELFGTGNATLAGNLTVSGGTITGGTSGMSLASGGTNQNITLTPSGTGRSNAYGSVPSSAWSVGDSDSSFNAGLVVGPRGTGSSFGVSTASASSPYPSGLLVDGSYAAPNSTVNIKAVGVCSGGGYGASLAFHTSSNTTLSEAGRFTKAGNLLLKSDGIDSGNGKLQLADHTTSAGGIGFGTYMSLFKGTGNGAFSFDDTSGANDTRLYLYNNGTMRGAFEAYNVASAVYVGAASAGWSTFITSGGQVTALTLDSSQNATFAGTGTSSFAGNLNIKGALGAHQTATLNLAYEGSSISQLVAYGADASTLGRVNIVLRKAGTGTDAVAGLSVRDFGIITQGGVAQTPASASATGAAGTIQWDASYIYICTATNTWKRVAIATW